MKKIVLAAVMAITLAGCAHDLVRPEQSRLQCADAPPIPDEPVTDEDNKTYLVGLYSSWENCHGAILWLRDYFAGQN